MLIVDAHLDLAMNALEWNRDLSRPIDEIRARERDADRQAGSRPRHGVVRGDAPRRRRALRGDADRALRRAGQSAARLALAGAGLGDDAGAARLVSRDGGARRAGADHRSRRRSIGISSAGSRQRRRDAPIGYVLSLEGADSIVTLAHLERAYAAGPARRRPGALRPRRLRATAPSATGDLGARGRELLREMERLGMILDATHLCDDSFRDALDHFHGPVWASHSNCRALVPHDRQFTDDQIRELDRARRRHRRGVRRLDARARLGARQLHAGARGRDARDASPITSTTSASSPATRGTAASAPISTARSAASSARPTSTPSPTSRGCRQSCAAAATPTRTSRPSRTGTSSGSCGRRGGIAAAQLSASSCQLSTLPASSARSLPRARQPQGPEPRAASAKPEARATKLSRRDCLHDRPPPRRDFLSHRRAGPWRLAPPGSRARSAAAPPSSRSGRAGSTRRCAGRS